MNVDLARWQFAFTTVNHFLFVVGIARDVYSGVPGPSGDPSRGEPR
jgi:hypothetical protein